VNRQAQAVVLVLLGGAILRVSLTDMYLRYVKEGLRPFLIAAGVVLVAAAVMTLWYERRADASHTHPEPRVGWLLIAPVLGLLLVAPPALGSYAAGQSGTALGGRQASDFPPLPAGDPVRVTVLDYASRAVFDKGRSLHGRRVQVTGFLAEGPATGREAKAGGRTTVPYLARMMLACCAADARPVKVALADGPQPGQLSVDSWIEVVGRYTDRTAPDPVNGGAIPYLEVDTSGTTPSGTTPAGKTPAEKTPAEETEEERWQRNFLELLQELRVAQTGVQILFAFLLTIVFNARFGELTEFQQGVYLVALLSAAGAVSMMIGPVAYHRMLFRRRRKPEIVRIAHRMASAGLAFMLVSTVSSVFLVVDFIVNKTAAGIVTGVVAVWFVVWWGVLPWLRRGEPDGAG
jgi:uncharacterized repeat protein (TIGR03943 family)